MVKISVIIPIYKVQNYIERCLNSVICQESDDYELECILVNDCTPDRSMAIVNSLLEDYHGSIGFNIINHDVNKGLSSSRNTGLKSAKGDFVFFLDSDDRLDVNALKKIVSELKNVAEQSKVDVVIGNTYLCKENKTANNFRSGESLFFDNNNETALRKLLDRELYHIACNKLVRRNLLLDNKILFEEGIIDEDMLWSYYVFLNARNILIIPDITYIYEDNPGSIMNTSLDRIADRISSRIIICNKILSNPPQKSFAEYYLYVFYILTRAINLYELNKNDDALNALSNDLFELRERLLKGVLRKHLFVLYIFFMTSKKPLYVLTNYRWYRRYYDRIAKCVLKVSKMMVC